MFLENESKKKIVEFLKEKLQPNFIYLFGSFAKGEGREDSDIDVAIHANRELDEYELFVLGNELSFVMKRDVQIIDLKDISTVFAAQIVGIKEILYSQDENLRIQYDMRSFKDYVKLNEERQIVMDSIKKDGKVYG
ncbi:type VII toxin-antitoxin system MntA family adenylyltransferase antitoxin [Clostridium botulinum]